MTVYSGHVSRKNTPQNQPIPGREAEMSHNAAGGVTFVIDDWQQLRRFLILGNEGGSYYASERVMTRANAAAVCRCIANDGPRVVSEVARVSVEGRAPKNDPALFVLALCSTEGIADEQTRAKARRVLPSVARIPTHLFTYLSCLPALKEQGKGRGNGFKRAMNRWYGQREWNRLVYQVLKYRGRGGWTHADVLRIGHVKPQTDRHQRLYSWITSENPLEASAAEMGDVHPLLGIYLQLHHAESAAEAVKLIESHDGVTWEMVPDRFRDDPKVWEALLYRMPMGAMVRQLSKLTSVGVVAPLSRAASYVISQLHNAEALSKSRIHPMSLLKALCVYNDSSSSRGKLSWEPVTQVVDALNDAFYGAFGNVELTGKRLLLAVDVSPSMGSPMDRSGILTAREAAGAMSLITAATEDQYEIVGFCGELVRLNISPKDRLDTVRRKLYRPDWDSTDASQPMLWAAHNNIQVDAFVHYTDNETWSGSIHPSQALQRYREHSGIPSRLVAVAFTATNSDIADPKDPAQLGCVGFDTGTPNVMSQFIRGMI
jgi:60 kDa SS-A/Ro ribonucleoprotein